MESGCSGQPVPPSAGPLSTPSFPWQLAMNRQLWGGQAGRGWSGQQSGSETLQCRQEVRSQMTPAPHPSSRACPCQPSHAAARSLSWHTPMLCWLFPPLPSWHCSSPMVRPTPGCSPGFNSKGSGGTLHPPFPGASPPRYTLSSNPPLLCAPPTLTPCICPEFSWSRQQEEGLATQLYLRGPLTILRDDPGHLLGCRGVTLDLIAYHQPIHL